VVKLTIDEKAIDPADRTMLEDLLTAALNATVEKARAAADAHLGKATGGIKIPGMMG
jgi:DNA-binding protein YbaB